MITLKKIFKKEIVFVISFLVMTITMVTNPPSIMYIEFINFKVIAVMFCLMLSVGGLYQENVFNYIAIKMIHHMKNLKTVSLALIFMTFFLGMFITNDAVLITLIPLTIIIFKSIHQEKHIILVLILQTIAANLGSAFTPMGDPQNIYLFTLFDLSFFEFVSIMFPVSLLGFILLAVTSYAFIPTQKVETIGYDAYFKSYKPVYYIIVFICTVLAIVNILPYYFVLFGVVFTFVFVDVKVIKRVDFFLIGTFVCFFIISGNIILLDSINAFFERSLTSGARVYFVSLGLSQVISNVPTAVLLSPFIDTAHIKDLLHGVNVGAMGTMVASLASLISLKYIRNEFPNLVIKYIITYTLLCIIYVVIISIVLFVIG